MQPVRYLGVIGLILFFCIIWLIGPESILANLLLLDPLVFAASLLVIVPGVITKAYKQCLLVNAFAVRLPLADSAKIWTAGYFHGSVSPGRAGDMLRCIYLSRASNATTGKCLTAVALERIFDVAMLFVFSILGLLFFSLYFFEGQPFVLPLVLLFALFVIAVLLFSKKGIVSMLLKPFFKLLVPSAAKEKLRSSFHEFYSGLVIYREKKALLSRVILWTAFSWLIVFFQYYLIALALRIDISYFFVSAIMPIVLLLSTLPIAFSGIGTRDAALVFFLSFLGISPDAAVSFSLAILLSNLLLAAVGLVFFHQRPREKASLLIQQAAKKSLK